MPLTPNTFAYRQSAITFFSNCAAFFNFLIYLYLAEIIVAAFFPLANDTSSTVSKLLALSVFSAGYLARPIGGFLFGRMGDIYGRKPVFLISSSVITIASLFTALLPTYHQVGILAPILFVVARLIQGMGFGAHSPLGWVVISEQVPRSKLAFFCGIFTVSFPATILLTMLFFSTLFDSFTRTALIEYAWRIPFVVSAVLNMLAIFLGSYIKETPIFINDDSQMSYWPKQYDLQSALKRFNAIFTAFLLGIFSSSIMFVVMILLPIVIPIGFDVDTEIIKFSNGLGIIFLGIGYVFFGVIADKGNIGKVLMLGAVAVIVQVFAMFYLLSQGYGDYLLFMYALLGFFSGVAGLGPVIILQSFPTRVRLTALSIAFESTFAFIGGILPFALIYLTNIVSFSPALYVIFVGLIGFAVGFYIYNTPDFKPLNASV
ncbi:MAG: MFS transporter [Psychrobacter sp.]|nr:MFS transporter [Psychrobacter sp.]